MNPAFAWLMDLRGRGLPAPHEVRITGEDRVLHLFEPPPARSRPTSLFGRDRADRLPGGAAKVT